ncbi:CHAT domain-containing protein [Streptomyces sp. NPDC048669]|uniref:CHAT domain-containing protein n=1 Tax=Streptomyces sp. NPDC048669 TaxID=3155267 RepID=UPI00343E4933
MSQPDTLNVTVITQGMTVRYQYELRVGGPAGDSTPLDMEYTVDVDPGLVKSCRAAIDQALTKAAAGESGPGPGPATELANLGKLLHGQLFPRLQGNEAKLVSRLHASSGPLQIRTNEHEVPWELLHDGEDFLALQHDLGCWLKSGNPAVEGRGLNRVGRALIVGDTLGDLPSAREEAAKVAAWLRDRGIECTVLLGQEATQLDVLAELASQETPYDLFHFCGHVATGSGTTGLMLHDRQLLGEVALQTLSSHGAPPVAFINGCASAGKGEVANLCVSFMALGAKTVVGTRTDVADEGAWQFAAEFYGQLLAGVPAGAAVRAARTELRDRPDAAWASFMLYGDPAAGIAGNVTPGSPRPPEPPEDDLTTTLAPDAQQLMRRVSAACAGRGGVGSVDLLRGLLGEADIRRRIEESIGARTMEALDRVIDQVLSRNSGPDGSPGPDGDSGPDGNSVPDHDGTGPDHDGSIRSDTVNRVFADAATRAATDGRSAVTTADITEAFVALGGGIASRLLELSGVPLARLLPDSGTDNGDDRLPMDDFGRSAAGVVRLANLLADTRGEVIGTYTLLLAFGAMGSEVLERAMHEQGTAGELAYRNLSGMLTPRRRDLSPRVHDVLEQARRRSAAGRTSAGRVGEAAILLALLQDEESSGRELLRRSGVDPDLLIQSLRRGR